MASGPHFEDPPVREVALTIYFSQLQTLQTLTLAKLRVDWLADYPKLSEVLPRPSWENSSNGFVEMLTGDAGWLMPLCEFINAGGDTTIYIQNDRFGITWRFDSKPEAYPGHEKLTAELLTRFAAFEDLVADILLTEVNVAQVTVGYVNHVEGISAQQLAAGVLTDWKYEIPTDASLASRCALRLGYLPSDAVSDPTAVTVGVEPCAAEQEGAVAASLSFDALRPVESRKRLASELEEAHDAVAAQFIRTTTEDMKRQWGGKW